MIRPATPTKTIVLFNSTIRTLRKPDTNFQYVNSSISAGKAKPRADKHRAPNSEINSSRLGMATASKTVTQQKRSVKSSWVSNRCNTLTCDEYEHRTDDVFPKYFTGTVANALHDVIGPCYVDGHIACQTVCNINGERQHSLYTLCQTMYRTVIGKNNKNTTNMIRCDMLFLFGCALRPVQSGCFLHVFARQVQCDGSFDVSSVVQVSKKAHANVQQHDHDHALIENAACAAKRLRCFHLIFERQHLCMWVCVYVCQPPAINCGWFMSFTYQFYGSQKLYTHHTDGFQGKQNGAKVQWKVLQFAHGFTIFQRQWLAENVIAYDAERDHRDDVGQWRERCQVFQIANLVNTCAHHDKNEMLEFL